MRMFLLIKTHLPVLPLYGIASLCIGSLTLLDSSPNLGVFNNGFEFFIKPSKLFSVEGIYTLDGHTLSVDVSFLPVIGMSHITVFVKTVSHPWVPNSRFDVPDGILGHLFKFVLSLFHYRYLCFYMGGLVSQCRLRCRVQVLNSAYLAVYIALKCSRVSEALSVARVKILALCLAHASDEVKKFSCCHNFSIIFFSQLMLSSDALICAP